MSSVGPIQRLLFLAILLQSVAACDDDDGEIIPPPLTRTAVCLDKEASPASTPAIVRNDVVDLFVIAEAPSLTAKQQWRLSNFVAEHTKEVHITRLVEDAFLLPEAGRVFGIRLSPSAEVVATVDTVIVDEPIEDGEPRVIFWSGPLSGTSGEISLSIGETGSAYGGIVVNPAPSRETAMYDIWALGGGLHAMICVDWTKFDGID